MILISLFQVGTKFCYLLYFLKCIRDKNIYMILNYLNINHMNNVWKIVVIIEIYTHYLLWFFFSFTFLYFSNLCKKNALAQFYQYLYLYYLKQVLSKSTNKVCLKRMEQTCQLIFLYFWMNSSILHILTLKKVETFRKNSC